MKKKDAANLFGGLQKQLAEAVGRTKGAISQWPNELTNDQVNLVIGAASRRGIPVPAEFLKP